MSLIKDINLKIPLTAIRELSLFPPLKINLTESDRTKTRIKEFFIKKKTPKYTSCFLILQKSWFYCVYRPRRIPNEVSDAGVEFKIIFLVTTAMRVRAMVILYDFLVVSASGYSV